MCCTVKKRQLRGVEAELTRATGKRFLGNWETIAPTFSEVIAEGNRYT